MTKSQTASETTNIEAADEGAIRQFMGYRVKRTYMVIQPAVQKAIEPLGLRIPSFSCLSVIVDHPGIAPSVLAEMLKMERSNIVLVLDELETQELISRAQMKTDRRRQALTATMRGKQVQKKAAAAIAEAEARLMSALSAEEQTLLISLLSRIEAAGQD